MDVDVGKFARAIDPRRIREPVRLRQGEIAAVSGNRVDVEIAGDSVAVPGLRYLDSYSPVVGHTVWLLQNDTDYIVLGRLA